MRIVKKPIIGETLRIPYAYEPYPSPSYTGQFQWTEGKVVKVYISTKGFPCAKVEYSHPATNIVTIGQYKVSDLRRN